MAVVITNKAQMKEIMKDEAKALVVRFCQLNGYAVPKLSVEKRSNHVCNYTTEGYYKNGGDVVAVVPGNTTFDTATSARYNVIDDTIYGAILHEVGHYIHEHYLNWEKSQWAKEELATTNLTTRKFLQKHSASTFQTHTSFQFGILHAMLG